MLQLLKNGSGIHIKEKNKGKFTSYCGGKVTDECIRKAKASGNPILVKRATFADNARHFKHRLGGSIVEAFKLKRGGKAFHLGVNISDSNPNAYKYVKKKYKMHQFGGVFNSQDNPNAFGGVYAEMMLGRRYDEQQRELKKQKELQEAQRKAQELELENQKTNSLLDVLSGVVQNKDWIVDLFNKNKKPSISMNGSSIITGKPNFSNQVITTESGMSGTVDDWRKAVLG